MQVYFIDNEDFFHRRAVLRDNDGIFFTDNDERAIFFARGVIETIKKLRWSPEIVHCHGWMTSVVPLILKYVLAENPLFESTKIVVSLYDDEFYEQLNKDFSVKLLKEGIPKSALELIKNEANYINLMKTVVKVSDAVIAGIENPNQELMKFAQDNNKPILGYQTEDTFVDTYINLYESL